MTVKIFFCVLQVSFAYSGALFSFHGCPPFGLCIHSRSHNVFRDVLLLPIYPPYVVGIHLAEVRSHLLRFCFAVLLHNNPQTVLFFFSHRLPL